MSIKTPLRYPGGKARALKQILPLIPNEILEYREPFLGGASVFLAVKDKYPQIKFKINDYNEDVYWFWKTLQDKPIELIEAINQIKKNCKDGKQLYSKLSKVCTSERKFGRALRFYILNRITYSGTSDSGGYSNESYEKRFTISKIKDLESLAKSLNNVDITKNSYENLLLEKGEKVFVFLDPPYWTARNFPLYGKKGDLNKFFNHKEFAENVKTCKHTWLITCDDSEFMRDLFSFAKIYPYKITPWELKYNGMHKKKAILGKELFITNYDPRGT